MLADDGNRYGPADVATLNQWIVDNRLLPHQMLEEEASGARLAAQAVPGLNFPQAQPSPEASAGPGAPGQPYSGYYRGPSGASADDGSREMTAAWILFGVGLLCCCGARYGGFLVPAAGIYFAYKAKQKGHPQGNLAFGLNIAVTTLALLWLVIALTVLNMIQSGQIPIPQNTR